MANVNCQAQILLSSGEVVVMSGTIAEGTTTELKTSTTYSVSATSLGQFAEGKSIVSFTQPVSSLNGIAFAYINRRGSIVAVCPVAVQGITQTEPCYLLGGGSLQIQAGDTLQVMGNTATSRLFAYSVQTSSGVQAIFTGTPSGAGNTDLTHILSGQSVGTSLVGQSIVNHYATSIDGSKLSTGGLNILDDKGLPVGTCTATDPADLVVKESRTSIRIGLNFIGRVITNA